jgi:lysophospholipid acyltransferase (LPLAT)-like uncharacterized protein
VPEANFLQKTYGRIAALLLPRALNLMNLRVCHYDRSADAARPEYDEHVIYVCWHEYIGLILPCCAHLPITVLCSQHGDGEIANQMAMALRLHIVRGSTSKGGSAAIRQLKRNSRFSSIALAPDGPRGPRREMAMGPIYMASLLRMPIVPMGVGISNVHRLNTWDQFAIPRPFSRLRLIFGPKIRIAPRLDRDQLESKRYATQKLLSDLSDEAESWANSGKKLVGQQPFIRTSRCNRKIFDAKDDSVLKKGRQTCPRRAA